jgi:hypothetical protein
MKADAMSFNFLANEGLVKIPFFQRGYVWEESNWEDMLSDLLDEKKNHFLGSLILKQQEQRSGKTKEVSVIDGQQRLTTLSILIKALFDGLPEDTQSNCKNDVYQCLFFKKNKTDSTWNVKIQHSRVDASFYSKVINGLNAENIKDISDKSHSILKCYNYFRKKLKDLPLDTNVSLLNRLLDNENKILVLIDLTDKEDEQTIFDTINSAGVRLSGADIIKNALFQKAIEVYGSNNDDVTDLYKTCWESVFSGDEDTINFWETSRPTGRLMRDNIEILLHSISVIKNIFDPDKHTLSDLSSLYKEFINSLDKEKLSRFANEIKDYAKLYREKIAAFNRSSLFNFTDNKHRLLHILEVCEISTFHPYLLSIFKKYEKDEKILNQKLSEIEKLIVRRMISKAETKNYNKLCKDFISDDSQPTSLLKDVSDIQILEGLKNISNKNAALMLFWIELKRKNDDSKQSIKELKYNFSLEHLMPQKWEEYWSNIPYVDSQGNILKSSEESKVKRKPFIYHIGNMTLLNSSLNTSLRNYIFEYKVNGEGQKKGIKSYADLSITSDDILKPFNDGDTVWNEQKIWNRTEKLYKEIISIW